MSPGWCLSPPDVSLALSLCALICISPRGAQDCFHLPRNKAARSRMRLRSPLFAPGDSERKMTKAIASEADAVILDLEDSVAAPSKPTARAMVPDVVRGHPGRGLIVRVN